MTKEITLLVVDDENDFLDSLVPILEYEGYKVVRALSGQEALRKLQQDIPHLIILDLVMPGMDGYQVAQKIREAITTKHLPIVMLTAKAEMEDQIKGLLSGVNDYLVKPFHPQELIAKIRVIIEHTYLELDANPLSRLPGNNAIRMAIEKAIQDKTPFAVGYLDLDNFKAFNDYYGFERGDRAIMLTARTIIDAISQLGTTNDFIGHIGGDDFVFITHPQRVEAICQSIINLFDQANPALYDEEALSKGYIISKNRHGQEEKFSIMTLSIGVVTNQQKEFQHLAEISQTATEMKEYVKSLLGSNYCIDRRGKEIKAKEPSTAKGSAQTEKKRILIVDDDPDIREQLSLVLEHKGYEIGQADNGACALQQIEKTFYHLVLMDIKLPDMSGLDLCREIKAKNRLTGVIIITGYASLNGAIRAIKEQAYDFLVKPLDLDKLILTIERGLREQDLIIHNQELINTLQNRNVEVKKRLTEIYMLNNNLRVFALGTISSLAATLEAKDSYTEGHSKRVTNLAVAIAKEINLPGQQVLDIERACLLHDIGKIGIPDSILLKRGKLESEEWQKMKMHPSCGTSILKSLDFLTQVLPLIEHHHERYDGKGYPGGLSGQDIPLGSRIMAVADAFDAMVSTRPYRKAKLFADAVQELKDNAGSQFDPQIVEFCLSVFARNSEETFVATESRE